MKTTQERCAAHQLFTAILPLAIWLPALGCKADNINRSRGARTTERVPGLFSAPNPWTRDVSGLATSASSKSIIGWLGENGGWGTGSLRIEFSIDVLTADASTPLSAFTPTSEFYRPDCDDVPFPVPA